MTISQLITQLAELQAEHGPEVEVWMIGDDNGPEEVEDAYIHQPERTHPKPFVMLS